MTDEDFALEMHKEALRKKTYFLKGEWEDEYREVDEKTFIRAESSAGFHSKFGSGHVATGGFYGSGVSGKVRYEGEAAWIDTAVAEPGDFVSGTVGNPVDTFEDAVLVADSAGLRMPNRGKPALAPGRIKYVCGHTLQRHLVTTVGGECVRECSICGGLLLGNNKKPPNMPVWYASEGKIVKLVMA